MFQGFEHLTALSVLPHPRGKLVEVSANRDYAPGSLGSSLIGSCVKFDGAMSGDFVVRGVEDFPDLRERPAGYTFCVLLDKV